jgi:hypothetical protein
MHEIVWDQEVEIGGTSLRGYFESPWVFEETVARLVAASGQLGTESGDKYKISVQFIGRFLGQPFSLYDYKEDREIHVGVWPDFPLAEFCEALLKLLSEVEPMPYEAREHYDLERWHRWPMSDSEGDECNHQWVCAACGAKKE